MRTLPFWTCISRVIVPAAVLAVATFVGTLSATAVASASTSERQQELLKHRFEVLEARAERGNAEAAFELGQAHLNGYGTEASPAEAVKWFERSAAEGNPDADYYLGYLYGSGALGEADPVRALHHYQTAGSQDHAAANYWLGLHFLERDDRGGYRDLVKGLDHVERSARAGYADAQYYFAYLLDRGLAGQGQTARSLEWMHKAAEQGQTSAQGAYATALLSGRSGSRDAVNAYYWFGKAGDAEGQKSAWDVMNGAERTRAKALVAETAAD